jgi:hypothetical protein
MAQRILKINDKAIKIVKMASKKVSPKSLWKLRRNSKFAIAFLLSEITKKRVKKWLDCSY